ESLFNDMKRLGGVKPSARMTQAGSPKAFEEFFANGIQPEWTPQQVSDFKKMQRKHAELEKKRGSKHHSEVPASSVMSSPYAALNPVTGEKEHRVDYFAGLEDIEYD